MNEGTQAAKEAGNLVDLDSNPTKLLDVVLVGKQLLVTRGALTTFSIANDVAKYFAILPAKRKCSLERSNNDSTSLRKRYFCDGNKPLNACDGVKSKSHRRNKELCGPRLNTFYLLRGRRSYSGSTSEYQFFRS
jgi:hypothetical protein